MEAQRRFRSVRNYHAHHENQNAVDRASYFFPDPEVYRSSMKFMVFRTQRLAGRARRLEVGDDARRSPN